MQLIKSVKVVFVHRKQILWGNPSDIKKGDKILLAKPRLSHLIPPDARMYEITSIVARMEHTVYIEVRVKPIQ